jgi:hypothetical protein
MLGPVVEGHAVDVVDKTLGRHPFRQDSACLMPWEPDMGVPPF